MKNITIKNKVFSVPADCFHVAVDRGGLVYAYDKLPQHGAISWVGKYPGRPFGVFIGALGCVVEDWRSMVYSFPQEEHSVTGVPH